MMEIQEYKEKIENVFKSASSLKNSIDAIVPAIKEHLLSNLRLIDEKFVADFSKGIRGIYFFCCICEKEHMPDLWKKHKSDRTCVSPFNNSHYKQCVPIINPNTSYPMYIGKSEEIKDRLKEHWYGTNEETTTKSMWLKEFLECNTDISVKMSYVDFSTFGADEYNYFICEEIEKKLRNILHPFIGWQ